MNSKPRVLLLDFKDIIFWNSDQFFSFVLKSESNNPGERRNLVFTDFPKA